MRRKLKYQKEKYNKCIVVMERVKRNSRFANGANYKIKAQRM